MLALPKPGIGSLDDHVTVPVGEVLLPGELTTSKAAPADPTPAKAIVNATVQPVHFPFLMSLFTAINLASPLGTRNDFRSKSARFSI